MSPSELGLLEGEWTLLEGWVETEPDLVTCERLSWDQTSWEAFSGRLSHQWPPVNHTYLCGPLPYGFGLGHMASSANETLASIM